MSKCRLDSVAVIKFLALAGIYWWHCPLPKPHVGLGGTMCTFLFVAAGFLVAYNYLDRNESWSWPSCVRYLIYKFLLAWPLHAVMFAVCAVFLCGRVFSSPQGWLIALSNLLMLHAWVPRAEFFFSFNGATWFLSALLPCYLLALPVVAVCRRRLQAVAIFVACCVLYCGFVSASRGGLLPFAVVLHVSPVSRFLQFCIGISGCAMCLDLVDRIREQCGLVNILETLAFVLFLGISWWIRDIYSVLFPVAFMCILAVFSMNAGWISWLAGWKPLQTLASCQFEFFVIHQVVIRMFSHFFHDWIRVHLRAGHNLICISYILTEAVLAVALSLVWHFSFAKSTKRMADKISRSVFAHSRMFKCGVIDS